MPGWLQRIATQWASAVRAQALPQDLELGLIFDEPLLGHDPAEVDRGGGYLHPVTGARPQVQQRTLDDRVELGIDSSPVKEPGAPLQKLGEAIGEGGDRLGVVGTVGCLGTLEPRPSSEPELLGRIALADEEPEGRLVARAEDGHRLRLFEAGQVEEVGVLSEGKVDVAIAPILPGGRQDGDPILAYRLHQLCAAFRKIL